MMAARWIKSNKRLAGTFEQFSTNFRPIKRFKFHSIDGVWRGLGAHENQEVRECVGCRPTRFIFGAGLIVPVEHVDGDLVAAWCNRYDPGRVRVSVNTFNATDTHLSVR